MEKENKKNEKKGNWMGKKRNRKMRSMNKSQRRERRQRRDNSGKKWAAKSGYISRMSTGKRAMLYYLYYLFMESLRAKGRQETSTSFPAAGGHLGVGGKKVLVPGC